MTAYSKTFPAITTDQVLTWEERRVAAQLAADVATLRDLFSKELIYIHSSAYVDTYCSYLEKIEGGNLKYLQIDSYDHKVQITPGAIFVRAKMVAVADVVGTERTIRSLISTAWVPDETGWKLRLFQSTEIDQALLARFQYQD
jgi:hypothetical protein